MTEAPAEAPATSAVGDVTAPPASAARGTRATDIDHRVAIWPLGTST